MKNSSFEKEDPQTIKGGDNLCFKEPFTDLKNSENNCYQQNIFNRNDHNEKQIREEEGNKEILQKNSDFEFNLLNGTAAKGPFYTDDHLNDYSRRNKVMAFVEKDLFVMNHYESASFRNRKHAIECISPYHVFQVPADNLKFFGSDVEINLLDEVKKLKYSIESTLETINYRKKKAVLEENKSENIKDIYNDITRKEILTKNSQNFYQENPGFTAQLLLFHEQRYFYSKIEKRIKKDKKFKRRSRQGYFIRIPRSKKLYIYGTVNKLHLKYKKKNQ